MIECLKQNIMRNDYTDVISMTTRTERQELIWYSWRWGIWGSWSVSREDGASLHHQSSRLTPQQMWLPLGDRTDPLGEFVWSFPNYRHHTYSYRQDTAAWRWTECPVMTVVITDTISVADSPSTLASVLGQRHLLLSVQIYFHSLHALRSSNKAQAATFGIMDTQPKWERINISRHIWLMSGIQQLLLSDLIQHHMSGRSEYPRWPMRSFGLSWKKNCNTYKTENVLVKNVPGHRFYRGHEDNALIKITVKIYKTKLWEWKGMSEQEGEEDEEMGWEGRDAELFSCLPCTLMRQG